MKVMRLQPVTITVEFSYALARYFGWIDRRYRCCKAGHRSNRAAYDCAKYNYTELGGST